jgi:hypothetical protein
MNWNRHRDSFDTNENDWDTGDIDEPDNAAGARQIVDGTYLWEIRANRDYATIASKSYAPDGDFYAAVDVQQLDGSAACGYGLLLRDGSAGVYQFGLANYDQQFSVFAWNEVQGASRLLIGPAESEAIHPGEVNQLAVIAEGAHSSSSTISGLRDDRRRGGRPAHCLPSCAAWRSAVLSLITWKARAVVVLSPTPAFISPPLRWQLPNCRGS